LSLPRSGSTLLQRLISAHPTVSTAPEPWFLLPLLSIDRTNSTDADYDFDVSRRAVEDFWTALPAGRASYLAAVGKLAQSLYDQASFPEASHFVDKTPRYHLILEDLRHAMPHAKFVFLWRNPLATIASMLEVDSHWNLYRYQIDLLDGWQNLQAFQESLAGECTAVCYEDLVARPAATMQRVWDYLGLTAVEPILTEGGRLATARMGDKTGTLNYSTISTESLSKWETVLQSSGRRAWARRYLNDLGPERLHSIGYDHGALLASLDVGPAGLGVTDYPWRLWGFAFRNLNAGSAVKQLRARRAGNGNWGHS